MSNKELKEVLNRNQNIFATEQKELRKIRYREKHIIRIKEGVKPIKGKFYRTSSDKDKIIKE